MSLAHVSALIDLLPYDCRNPQLKTPTQGTGGLFVHCPFTWLIWVVPRDLAIRFSFMLIMGHCLDLPRTTLYLTLGDNSTIAEEGRFSSSLSSCLLVNHESLAGSYHVQARSELTRI